MLFFLFGMVFAQSPEKDFTTLFDSAGVLSAKKQYQNAIQICKQAMAVAEKTGGTRYELQQSPAPNGT